MTMYLSTVKALVNCSCKIIKLFGFSLDNFNILLTKSQVRVYKYLIHLIRPEISFPFQCLNIVFPVTPTRNTKIVPTSPCEVQILGPKVNIPLAMSKYIMGGRVKPEYPFRMIDMLNKAKQVMNANYNWS